MKRILTIMVVLVVLLAGVSAAPTEKDSAFLTLSFQKIEAATYDIGWYADTSGSTVSSKAFTVADQDADYTAYIGLSIGFSDATVTVKLSMPTMKNASDPKTIGYTADISDDASGHLVRTTAAQSQLSADESGTVTEIGTMTGSISASATGYLPVKFHLDQADVAAATPNVSYSATVVASVWAE